MFHLIGQRFGELVINDVEQLTYESGRKYWKATFVCDCGGNSSTSLNYILDGRKTHCGCKKKTNKGFHKHGMTNTPEWQSWRSMKKRCLDPKNKNYHQYGGLGISICDQWLDEKEGFINFYKDMGPRPEGTTLDRISPWGNYEPSNCRWADAIIQGVNKKNSHGLTKTSTYQSWMHMRRNHEYPKEWDDIKVFLFDMGERPNGHQLTRKDLKLPHSIENSYWVKGSAVSVDYISQRNGSLVVIDREPNDITKAIVKCDCGTVKSILISNLKKTKSCGCLKNKRI